MHYFVSVSCTVLFITQSFTTSYNENIHLRIAKCYPKSQRTFPEVFPLVDPELPPASDVSTIEEEPEEDPAAAAEPDAPDELADDDPEEI